MVARAGSSCTRAYCPSAAVAEVDAGPQTGGLGVGLRRYASVGSDTHASMETNVHISMETDVHASVKIMSIH